MSDTQKHTEKESFAARWSRRKQQPKHGQEANGEAPDEAGHEIHESGVVEANEAKSEQLRAERLAKLNTLEDADMPDISTLDEDSDFSQFMSTNVSEGLRKLALHKLFHGKGFNIRDGLDEYDGDYTSFEKLDPGTITADMKHRLEVEAEKLKAKLEKEKAGARLDGETQVTEEPDEPQNEQAAIESETTEVPASEHPPSDAEIEDQPDTAQAEIEKKEEENT
jgi:hypothetical protein